MPAALERALGSVKVVYLQNGPHNPTGRAPASGRRRELAAILDRHRACVIEDSTLADLNFAGRVRPELADLCRHATVASVGSFSKVAWAGLRIGWLRAPAPLVVRTLHLRLASDLGPSVPSQLLVLNLLPHLDEMAAERCASLAETAAQTVERLAADFPDWRVETPDGGSVLWVELPVDDSGPFTQVARRYGVTVAPGSVARVGRAADPHIRICIDRPWPLIDAGLQRLQLAWRDLLRSAPATFG
jgi:DNA-binding transcriptional MocR family regulator